MKSEKDIEEIRNLIRKYINELELDEKTYQDSIKMLNKAISKKLLKNRRKNVVAASIIYISALLNDSKKTQRQMEDVSGASPPGIRGFYRVLFEKIFTRKEKCEGNNERRY